LGTGLDEFYKPFRVDSLKNRHERISRNPSDAVKDRLTQSGGWYGERPKMIAAWFKQEISLLDLSCSIELARIYSKR
jgi:hypothetical protein